LIDQTGERSGEGRKGVWREEVSWGSCPEISIEPYPTPIPSNPQHNPERPTRPREPDPHHQRTERDSERGERVERGDCEDKGSGEMIRISGGERGVLRLGMVSEGGEYGSYLWEPNRLYDSENLG